MPVITDDAIFPVPIKPKFITQSFINILNLCIKKPHD